MSRNDEGLRLRMRAELPEAEDWSWATKSMPSPRRGTRPPSAIALRWAWSTNTTMLPEPSFTLKLMPLPFLNGRGSLRTSPARRTTPKFIVASMSPMRTSSGSRVLAMSQSRTRPTVESRTAAQRRATRLMRFSTFAPQ